MSLPKARMMQQLKKVGLANVIRWPVFVGEMTLSFRATAQQAMGRGKNRDEAMTSINTTTTTVSVPFAGDPSN